MGEMGAGGDFGHDAAVGFVIGDFDSSMAWARIRPRATAQVRLAISPSTTAAAVSSQLVSMPRMIMQPREVLLYLCAVSI